MYVLFYWERSMPICMTEGKSVLIKMNIIIVRYFFFPQRTPFLRIQFLWYFLLLFLNFHFLCMVSPNPAKFAICQIKKLWTQYNKFFKWQDDIFIENDYNLQLDLLILHQLLRTHVEYRVKFELTLTLPSNTSLSIFAL